LEIGGKIDKQFKGIGKKNIDKIEIDSGKFLASEPSSSYIDKKGQG